MDEQKPYTNTETLQATRRGLDKESTGVSGLDEILHGGLPKERVTLISGGPGCGKTLLSLGFLVHGARERDQPGLFVSFEETPEELTQNVASLGYDLDDLVKSERLAMLHFQIDRDDFQVSGEYDLTGLFVQLEHTIDRIGAQRVALDTIEAFLTSFPDQTIVRLEIRRLFRWLKTKGVTTVVTTERGGEDLTQHALEEYVADCVIFLNTLLIGQSSTRQLQVIKYRGSAHGTDRYPFLITERGLSVSPITSVELDYVASTERISTGIRRLDKMLEGEGFLRGTSVLVSGPAGSGKTSVGASFVDAACRRGERCVIFAAEESPDQLQRNMRSIGIDLQPWIDAGLLAFYAARPTLFGLEQRLVTMQQIVEDHEPAVVVVDPITGWDIAGSERQVQSILMRLVDFLKGRQITGLFTSLTPGTADPEQSVAGISSLMDTWLTLNVIKHKGERNRILQIVKSRGMSHSNQAREFLITDAGIELIDVYLGEGGVLAGTARQEQELRDEVEHLRRQLAIQQQEQEIARKKEALESQTALLSNEVDVAQAELAALQKEYELWLRGRRERAAMRGQDVDSDKPGDFDRRGQPEGPGGGNEP